MVEELGAVTLLADYTTEEPGIKVWLDRFNSISVPLTVIFPGREPNKPIVLRDVYTKTTLLESLRKAGPSRGVGTQTAGGEADLR